MFHSLLAWFGTVISTPGGASFVATLLRDAAEILESEAAMLDGVDADMPATSGPASTGTSVAPATITIPRP